MIFFKDKVQADKSDAIERAVNPVVNSAKGSLLMLKEAGVPEAVKFYERFHFEEMVQAKKNPFQTVMARGFASILELRYQSINYYALKAGIKNIVDLGCGYSPRGYFFKQIEETTKMKYFGIDLPAVIKDLRIAGNDMNYIAADITNLSSLEKALKDVTGKILIITEGVLPYFTESELRAAVQNIMSLLDKYKGVWITPDFHHYDFIEAVMKPILGDAEYPKAIEFMNQLKKTEVGTEIRGAEAFVITKGMGILADCGIKFQDIPYVPFDKNYLRLAGLTDQQKSAVLENYRDFKTSLMYVESGNVEVKKFLETVNLNNRNSDFIFTVNRQENCMTISLHGRLDTISSPELMAFYENSVKSTNFEKPIVFDCSQLDYISSAGIRVFLVIWKDRNGQMKLINTNKLVNEILDQTGLREMFCK